MSSVQQMLTATMSWVGFVLFSVFPIAFRELVHWVYEWQVLVAGILAVIAAGVWGKAVVRGARIAAAQAPVPVPGKIVTPQSPAPAARAAAPRLVEATPAPAVEPLQALRETIRTTLTGIPYTDEPLTPERMALCSKVLQFPVADLAAKAARQHAPRYELLQKELSSLGDMSERNTCRNAWQVLVRINDAARDLLEVGAGKASSRP
ncbi:MAG: hypothetical protein KGJ78_02290 [Alphaproteobacteria bacterium]|nr:hypothetical protein [Alphaproteobacteria bacterium]